MRWPHWCARELQVTGMSALREDTLRHRRLGPSRCCARRSRDRRARAGAARLARQCRELRAAGAAADGIELVAPDLPGHGRSAHLPPGADYSFAGAVHAVLDIADALGWERFSLLGHSMGAGIGSLVAAACPQRIERFVAIEALGALAEVPERTVRACAKRSPRRARCATSACACFPTSPPRCAHGCRPTR